MGPLPPSHYGGYQYCITFIDDHSRYLTMYFMRNKSDAPQMLKRYIADVCTFLHANGVKAPLTVRSDNGGEYMSEEWADICVDNGMRHQTSTPYNPRITAFPSQPTAPSCASPVRHTRKAA